MALRASRLTYQLGGGIQRSIRLLGFSATTTTTTTTTTTWHSSMSYPRNDFENKGLLKPGHFSLQVGAPNQDSLKSVAAFLQAATLKLYGTDRFEQTMQYGVAPGSEPVCEEVSKFLTRQYGMPVKREDIFISGGASSGLEVLMKHYFKNDQIVFAENPTYPVFAMLINKDKMMRGVGIEIQSDGLNLIALEEELKKLPSMELTPRRPYRAAVYLVPTHHNPTGICYSPEKCEKLIQLARKYDLLIICDDVYNTLNYKTDPNNPEKFLFSPKRLFAYDDPNDSDYKGSVISNGSFSKIVAPGLRMGWYEAPQHVIKSLQDSYLAHSGGGQTYFVSHVVAEALKAGFIDDHVQKLRVAHKARMEAVISTVEENLSKYGVTISHPEGGYFLWVKLPQSVDSARVLEISKTNENVTFVKGNLASINGDFSNYIRLCIAYYEVPDIREGTQRLCRSIEAAIKEKGKL